MKQQLRYSIYLDVFVLLGDLAVLNITFLLTFIAFKNELTFTALQGFYPMLVIINLGYVPCKLILGVDPHTRIIYAEKIVQRSFYGVVMHAVFFFAFLIIFKVEDISRLFIFSFYVFYFSLLVLWRLSLRFSLKYYRKSGYNYRTVVILGADENGRALYDQMIGDSGYGYHIAGFFDDCTIECVKDRILGPINSLKQYLEMHEVDAVYSTLSESYNSSVVDIINYCENNCVRFFIVPRFFHLRGRKLVLQALGDIPVLAMRKEPLQFFQNRLLKRFFDVLFASIILLTFFPIIYIIVAIGIKITSPGPIFFKQKRTGFMGKDFVCYKFRSMKVNKESDVLQATKDDKRKTWFGNLLRKLNIDELPQFYNVLIGNMSVVGPRPHMLKHTQLYSELVDKYMLRHLVKSGITGWAQVKGFRGETKEIEDMEKRVKCDVWYIENWSFFLDIKILFLTISNLIRGDKNAY